MQAHFTLLKPVVSVTVTEPAETVMNVEETPAVTSNAITAVPSGVVPAFVRCFLCNLIGHRVDSCPSACQVCGQHAIHAGGCPHQQEIDSYCDLERALAEQRENGLLLLPMRYLGPQPEGVPSTCFVATVTSEATMPAPFCTPREFVNTITCGTAAPVAAREASAKEDSPNRCDLNIILVKLNLVMYAMFSVIAAHCVYV
jgi:hypothetical protein